MSETSVLWSLKIQGC